MTEIDFIKFPLSYKKIAGLDACDSFLLAV